MNKRPLFYCGEESESGFRNFQIRVRVVNRPKMFWMFLEIIWIASWGI